MRLALASIILLAGCAYSGPPEFQAIGEGYVRGEHDCSDMAWEWINHLIDTGTKAEDLPTSRRTTW